MTTLSPPMKRYQALLEETYIGVDGHGGSDLHVVAGETPRIRVDGRLVARGEPLSQAEVEALALELFGERGLARQREEGTARRTIELRGVQCRARVTLGSSCGSYTLGARLLTEGVVVSLEALRLPAVVAAELLTRPSGLLVVAGPHGSGKTTTLWACVQWMLDHEPVHVCTVEDAVERRLSSAGPGLIQQREVGTDVPDVASGIAAAMDQDLDVLVVTELRLLDALSAVLHAAETGHRVLVQVQASSARDAVERLVEAVPDSLQASVRRTLSESLVGVVWQRLLPRLPKGRVAAYEVLVPDDRVRAALQAGQPLHDLPGAPSSVRFEDDLRALEREGLATPEAVARARR